MAPATSCLACVSTFFYAGFMFGFGIGELLVVLVIILVVFGAGRLPEVMGSKPFEGYVTSLPPAELCKPPCSFADFHLELFRYTGIL